MRDNKPEAEAKKLASFVDNNVTMDSGYGSENFTENSCGLDDLESVFDEKLSLTTVNEQKVEKN